MNNGIDFDAAMIDNINLSRQCWVGMCAHLTGLCAVTQYTTWKLEADIKCNVDHITYVCLSLQLVCCLCVDRVHDVKHAQILTGWHTIHLQMFRLKKSEKVGFALIFFFCCAALNLFFLLFISSNCVVKF